MEGEPRGAGRAVEWVDLVFYNVPVTQPFSVPYTIGAGGAGGTLQVHGNAGSAGQLSFQYNLVANGGRWRDARGQVQEGLLALKTKPCYKWW